MHPSTPIVIDNKENPQLCLDPCALHIAQQCFTLHWIYLSFLISHFWLQRQFWFLIQSVLFPRFNLTFNQNQSHCVIQFLANALFFQLVTFDFEVNFNWVLLTKYLCISYNMLYFGPLNSFDYDVIANIWLHMQCVVEQYAIFSTLWYKIKDIISIILLGLIF